MNAKQEAGYRVMLKRIIRVANGGQVTDEATADLERAVQSLVNSAPDVVARGLERVYKDSVRAWERGNNSGNETELHAQEAICAEKREYADRFLNLYGVIVDYPGLYPSFSFRGADYHNVKSLLRNVAEKGGK